MPYTRPEQINDSLQELRNNVGQMEVSINHAKQALREIVEELQPMIEGEAVERLAIARYNIAKQALKLDVYLPRIQAIRDELRNVAGEKAMKDAAKPPVFQR